MKQNNCVNQNIHFTTILNDILQAFVENVGIFKLSLLIKIMHNVVYCLGIFK